MRYGSPSIKDGHRCAHRAGLRPHPGPAPLPAVQHHDHGIDGGRGRCRRVRHDGGPGTPHGPQLPRPPCLSDCSPIDGSRVLGRTRPAEPASHVLPRHSPPVRGTRRPLSQAVRRHRARPRRAPRARARPVAHGLPIALRQGDAGSRPDLDARLTRWGRRGVKGVDVICPGFAADCLETLEEVAISSRERFTAAGGSGYRYIPALNDRWEHITALAEIVADHTRDWSEQPLRAPERRTMLDPARNTSRSKSAILTP